MKAEQYIAYFQDEDGNEHTLKITNCDPDDGTLCIHLDGRSWVRLVPISTEDKE